MPCNKIQKAADITAAVCGAALLVYFLCTAGMSLGLQDEVFYLTVGQRLLQGDRLLVDEWHLSQLGLLLNTLPYWLFTKLTGGTEGVVLFSRYLFIGIDLLFYAFLYGKLRRFGFAGAAAAFLFCALFPQGVCALCYYTVSTMAVMALCAVLLLDPKEKSAAALVLCGIVLACGVLSQPLLIFAFLLYFLAVAVRELRGRGKTQDGGFGFILNRRTFLLLLLGAVSMFAVFMAFLFFTGTLKRLPEMLPYLLKDENYAGSKLVDWNKLADALSYYGVLPLAGLCLSAAAAAFYRINKKKDVRLRLGILIAVCVFTAWCYAHGAFAASYLQMVEFHEFPILLWAPAVCLQRKEKDARTAATLLTGLLFSALVDVSSANVLGSGGKIAFAAGAIGFAGLWKELRTELAPKAADKKRKQPQKSGKAQKRALLICAAVCCAVFAAWNLGFIYIEGLFKPQDTVFFEGEDARLTQTLTRGPYKGLKTTAKAAEAYTKTLGDLDKMRALANGGRVAVPDRLLYAYLYLDLPYGVPSAWYPFPYAEQYTDYWTVLPENRPAYIYIPRYNTFSYDTADTRNRVEEYASYMDLAVTEGQAGYILEVRGMDLSAAE